MFWLRNSFQQVVTKGHSSTRAVQSISKDIADIGICSKTVALICIETETCVQSRQKVSRQDYDVKQGHIGKHRVFRTNWPIN